MQLPMWTSSKVSIANLTDHGDGCFTSVGGKRLIYTNVRIVTATHRNLSDMISDGLFREDLYYRLNVVPIFVPPLRERNIKVLGKQALGMFLVGTHSMESANYISKFDKKIANKLGYVMSGGDLSESTMVSEQYLLELEREAFLSLCGERKTLERIQHMLKTGKPLRN